MAKKICESLWDRELGKNEGDRQKGSCEIVSVKEGERKMTKRKKKRV